MKLIKHDNGDLELNVNGKFIANWEAFPITEETLDRISHMFRYVFEEGKEYQRELIKEALGIK